jgi:NADH dehydrogenase
VEPILGDLTDRDSLERACSGIAVVVATANAAVPTRASDTFQAVDRQGYRNLIDAANSARVQRFVYTSALVSKYQRLSPLLQCKWDTEQLLAAGRLDHVILRAGVFMDLAFAMMGSALPIQNSENATVLRPFAFANRHFARIRTSIPENHIAQIPGDGTSRHGFVCIEDVAEFLVSAAFSGPAGIHNVCGPQALTFLDIVSIYERLLGVSLSVRRSPAIVFRAAAGLLRPFSAAAANLMALNYIAAVENTLADNGAASLFGVRLTSAEDFLRAKMGSAKVPSR